MKLRIEKTATARFISRCIEASIFREKDRPWWLIRTHRERLLVRVDRQVPCFLAFLEDAYLALVVHGYPMQFSNRATTACVDFVPVRFPVVNHLADSGFVHGGRTSMPDRYDLFSRKSVFDFPIQRLVESIMVYRAQYTREILTHESRRVCRRRKGTFPRENTRARSLCVYKSLPTRHFAQSVGRRSLIKLLRESVSFNTPLVFVNNINSAVSAQSFTSHDLFCLISKGQPV